MNPSHTVVSNLVNAAGVQFVVILQDDMLIMRPECDNYTFKNDCAVLLTQGDKWQLALRGIGQKKFGKMVSKKLRNKEFVSNDVLIHWTAKDILNDIKQNIAVIPWN